MTGSISLSRPWTLTCVRRKVKLLDTQSCPTFCDHMDCSLPDSSLCGILQTRILEWVAFPSPGDLPDPGIEPRSPELQVDSLLSEPPGKPQDVNINNFMKGNIWSLGCLQSCKLKHILHGICVLFETLFEKCHTGIRSKSKLGSGLPKVCILHISSPGGGT